MLAWLRRLIVSVGIGGASYALMLGIMVLSVVYDQEFEPVITFAFDAGRSITNWLDSLVSFADWIWQASLSALSSRGDSIPGATKLVNIARQGFSGHHYVIMALCSIVASFLVNAAFAFATKPCEALSPAQLAVAWKNNHDRRP